MSSPRILVVRLGAMGDVIHALPAVAALRARFPEAQLGWVIEERWAELLASCEGAWHGERGPQKPLVDHLHLVNTFAWRSHPFSDGTWNEARGSMRELRGMRYDVAVDFQGAWKSAFLARLSAAPVRVGLRQTREQGAGIFYNRLVIPLGAHVVEQNLELAAQVATPGDNSRRGETGAAEPASELPLDAARERWADEELARRGLSRDQFAVINPGAGWGAKRWPLERYSQVARALGDRGLPTLINFGPSEEGLAQAVAEQSGGAAQAVRCSISELIALLRRARLFVGGDTGPLHLAAALRVPVVAIFGPTDPARNGPYGTQAVVLRNPESVTDHSRRTQPEQAMLAITAEHVVRAATRLLEGTPTGGGEAHRG